MAFDQGRKCNPEKGVVNAGELVFYGILLLWMVTTLFGVALLLFTP